MQTSDTPTAAALIQTGRLLLLGNPAFPKVFGTAVFNTVFGFSDEKPIDAGLFVAHFELFFTWKGGTIALLGGTDRGTILRL